MNNKSISVSNLVHLNYCKDAYEIAKLHLQSKDSEFFQFTSTILSYIKDSYKSPDFNIESFIISNLKRSWFRHETQYQQFLARYTERFLRLYAAISAYDIVATNITYKVELPNCVSYHDIKFNLICGKVDFILAKSDSEDNGGKHYIAVSCCSGAPIESYKARKPENKPENSIELLCMKLGLSKQYPGISSEKWYIKSKKDTGLLTVPFEVKDGYNRIRLNIEIDQCMNALYSAVEIIPNKECNKCFFEDICCLKNEQMRSFEPNPEPKITKSVVPKFTDAQEKIRTHKNGPMNVIAVPGAGKTFTLVHRLIYLISQKIDPSNILMITFTNQAAAEIQSRVELLLGTNDRDKIPKITTFNSFGYDILRDNSYIFGRSSFHVISKVVQFSLIEKALQLSPNLKGISYGSIAGDNYSLVTQVRNWFKTIDLSSPEEFIANNTKLDTDGIITLYNCYKQLFDDGNYITFDEQISLVNQLFTEHPDILGLYQRVFRYIMVDEMQDIDDEQFHLIRALAGNTQNIVCVGDDDQSVYKFRGGTSKYLLNYTNYFPDAKTVYMCDNFRCPDKVISACNDLICQNITRSDKQIIAHKNGIEPVLVKNFNYSKLLNILQDIFNKGSNPGDVAIISRKNKTLYDIKRFLNSNGIQTTDPKDYLINEPQFQLIKDIINLILYGFDLDFFDDELLYRILWRTGHQINGNMINTDNGLYAGIMESQNPELIKAVADIKELILMCKLCQNDITLVFGHITDFLQVSVEHPVITTILETIQENNLSNLTDISIYMENMCIYQDEKRCKFKPDKDLVNLSTAHDSKGKEFPVVIAYQIEEYEDNEEERRLLFVVISRAQNLLYITQNDNNSTLVSNIERDFNEK